MKNTKTEKDRANGSAQNPTASITTPPPVEVAEPTVQVLTRFTRAELNEMQEETGANADATAVACFVRKNLRKRA
ncbi:MAG: hypothetical protein II840_10515 [Kiritimatiellae bacterium]|nr:hypothetical protein [Kiritimatiellia bacterium]